MQCAQSERLIYLLRKVLDERYYAASAGVSSTKLL